MSCEAKSYHKKKYCMMEYVIPPVFLQVCKQKKVWNLMFHFYYSEVKVISK